MCLTLAIAACGGYEDASRCKPACVPPARCVGRAYPVMAGGMVPLVKESWACERGGAL